MDREPELSHESVQYRLVSLRQMMPNVIRDLENLLNTRCSPVAILPGYAHLPESLICYGLADFSNQNPASALIQQRLCSEIEKKIARFEPRLKNVTVNVEPRDSRDKRVVFRISGLLKIEPLAEPVLFDTFFDSNRGQYVIST